MGQAMDIPPKGNLRRVVVIGGGFGGLRLCQNLGDKRFQIVLIDKTNHHNFQPLLYQVATSGLEPSSISFPFRSIFVGRKNFYIRMCTAQSVDAQKKILTTSCGEISYDDLIIATGCDTNYFGNASLKENTMALKTAAEALFNRNQILGSFEKALSTTSPEERERLLTFVIVGGGATGVELAGALAEMRRFVLKREYPDLPVNEMRIILVDGKDRLLYSFKEKSSREAEAYLKRRSVELRQNTRVASYDGEILILSDGTIRTANVFWTAGVVANGLSGLPEESYGPGKRILVDEFNRVKGLEDGDVYAIGDTALMISDASPDGHPQVAQPALQQGANLAKNLIARASGRALTPFKYQDRGSMATIGRNHAVVETPLLCFGGVPGWIVWLVIHLVNIMGVKNRLFIFINWIWSYFMHNANLSIIITPVLKGKRIQTLARQLAEVNKARDRS